jgi:acyl-CoA thioesterase FadM
MLYWYFRNVQCIVRAFFKSKIDPTKTMTSTFWANPFDSDWMNSIYAGRYFTYTDAVRWEQGVRSGLFKYCFKKKLVVILGGQKIIYRRPVKLFRRFNIVVKIAGWDDKWIYAAHKFMQFDKTCVVSFTKIGLRRNGKLYSPIETFKGLGFSHVQTPGWVEKHFQNDVETLKEIEHFD